MKTNTTPEAKDTARIKDMAARAGIAPNGVVADSALFAKLARLMAAKITKQDKALRRARAAQAENFPAIADIFYERYRELGGSASADISSVGTGRDRLATAKAKRGITDMRTVAPTADMVIRIKNVAFRDKERASDKPRLYFWDDTAKHTDLVTMFMQRYTPSQVFAEHVDTVLRPLGMFALTNQTRREHGDGPVRVGGRLGVKVRWSQYAGCRSCPCSPGFVVDAPDYEYDVHVHYEVVTDKKRKGA